MFIAISKNKERISIEDTLASGEYYCPYCQEKLTLKKLGLKKRPHFAHKSNGKCSEYKYSDMCQWHIDWQKRFPEDNIEVIKVDEDGKKHVADVLISQTEIEFQHSYMPFDEFNDRNEFYSKFDYRVIWVFDGNDIFNKGFNIGPFPFSKKFECLKRLKNIPTYLDIFIEGEVQYNLLTDSGLFLHHVGDIDEKKGIIFDGKCTIKEFIDNVNNNIKFDFKASNNTIGLTAPTSDNNDELKKQTLLDISEQYSDANYLIAYNTVTEYDVLINKNNINRLKQGKKSYGKLKKHDNYGKFNNASIEIYYVKDQIWIYQMHY